METKATINEVLVVDGQGGGLGRSLIAKLKEAIPTIYIVAVGTNSAASGAMQKAGADVIATGENAIIWNAGKASIITGGLGIISANSLLGEISPSMATAIASSGAYKFLVPISRCHIRIPNTSQYTLPQLVEATVADILEHLQSKNNALLTE